MVDSSETAELTTEQKLEIGKKARQAFQQALGSLKKGDLTELKALNNPPAVVQEVLSFYCSFLGFAAIGKQPNWAECKKMLANPSIL